ncbi:MAG: putative ammonium transporter [Methanosaeta sp. PtaB.Bin039]|nr:MAG: putative ammonium transporter [Methanosaeta sp. PtaB.Bin039]HOT07285.1 ammonium transporter [Methanotrichaceae archaeon]HQF15810.1 ammonium transporter [Methanotrichaceae archaeon]HQI90514.1 ammonium transporter [Methanotrichaceae archaeon]HQJ28097.1 ammonium transporter [Methanotrichaceae archaeon]
MALDSGDTAWVLASTAMVMLMTPGVGLFYGGLVRSKTVVSMIGLSFLAFALASVQWIVFGYSLAFGPDIGGIIGGLDFLGLSGVGIESAPLAATIPHLLYMAFQLVFAAVTLAILTSAVAERIKLSSFIVLALLWTTLVYDPLAHWVWAGGWLAKLGALDFAGGTVVHISSGFSALALAIVIGRRTGFGSYVMEPHNIPMSMIGAGLLWFGWFGFNAGSALTAGGLAASAFVVTNTSAAAGALAWLAASWMKGKPSALGMVSGGIAGLVAITPAAGYVDAVSSLIIGAAAGVLCYTALLFRVSRGLDESLDAWAVHGMGGLWGAIATGIFASPAVNAYSGLLYGDVGQFVAQVLAAAVSVVYAFGVTYLLARAVDSVMGLRVSEDEEYVGLDIATHGEKAYA